MTKAEYMELLRKNLERFSKELQEEILEDYNQHFAEGEKQGKTDEEIIRELGNIDEMIQGLSEVDGENTRGSAPSESVEKEKRYQYSGEYRAVELECDVADIELEPSEDGQIHVDYELDGSESFCRRFNFYQREEGRVLYAGLSGGDWSSRRFLGIDVNIRWNGNKTYSSRFGGFGREGGSAVLKVKMPEKLPRLIFTTGSGNVHADGLAVGAICGHVGSGDLSADGLSVDSLKIQTGSGELEIRNVSSVEADVFTGSGNLRAEKLEGGRVKLSTASGDLTAAYVKAEELEATSASGDVELKKVKTVSGQISSASGDVNVQEIQAQTLTATSASGDVNIRTIRAGMESCRCQTASGDVELSFTGPVKRIDADTVSGDIRLDLEGAEGMEANVNAKIGDVKISWMGERARMSQGIYRYGDGSCKVNAKTHTGDIEIVGR